MKDSHNSDKHRKDLQVRKRRSKSKKRHRDLSVSLPCSDSDKARSNRKRKRGDSTRKRVQCPSSEDENVQRRRRKAKKSSQHESSGDKKRSVKGKRLSPTRRKRTKIRSSHGSRIGSSRHSRSHRSPVISSQSSYSSQGCSTCSDCSSTDGSKFERSRRSVYDRGDNKFGTRDRPERTTKTLYKKNTIKRSNPSKPQSCSSCSGCSSSSHNYLSKKKSLDGNKRLRGDRSVMSSKSSKEIHRSNQNVAEVIHDNDDYAPSRSNDSYDQGRKRDGEMPWMGKKRRVEEGEDWNMNVQSAPFTSSSKALHGILEKIDVKGKDTHSSYKGMSSIEENDALCAGNEVPPTICEFVTVNTQSGKKSEISTNTQNLENEDLELLLRKKALENFRKFRNELHEKERSLDGRPVGSDIGTQSIAKDQTHKQEQPKKVGGNGGATEQTPKNIKIVGGLSKGSIQKGMYEDETRGETNDKLPNSEKSLVIDNNIGIDESKEGSGTPREMDHKDSLQSKQVGNGTSINKDAPCLNKNGNIMKLVSNPEEPYKRKLYNQISRAKNVSIKEAIEMPQAAAQNRDLHNGGVSKIDGSASALSLHDPEKGGCAVDNSKVEVKDSSQFQQKTMSVMRGGEMVQVSYKVYIPQKAPALARRQLQR